MKMIISSIVLLIYISLLIAILHTDYEMQIGELLYNTVQGLLNHTQQFTLY